MPILEGCTSVELFKVELAGTERFLDPFVNDSYTEHSHHYGARGVESQIHSYIEKDHIDHVLEFVDFAKALKAMGEKLVSASGGNAKDAVLAAYQARNAYNEFGQFLDSFGDKHHVADRVVFDVVHPNPDYNVLKLRFDAFSEEDDIPEFKAAPEVGPHDPLGITSLGVVHREDVPHRGETWDHKKFLIFEAELDRLEEVFGDKIYGLCLTGDSTAAVLAGGAARWGSGPARA